MDSLHWTRKAGGKHALIFVHGYLGSQLESWGDMPSLLQSDPEWAKWDIAFFGYDTFVLPRFKRKVSYDERIRAFISRLQELQDPPNSYEAIGLVGHSFGGLLILGALHRMANAARLDPAIAQVVTSVRLAVLYGTPVQGSDRITAWIAIRHPELWQMYRLEPERQQIVQWLADRVERPLLVLPCGPVDAAILMSVVYSPSDLWVGPREARGLAPGDLAKSIDVSHTAICKPTSHSDVRYRVLCTTRARAEHVSPSLVRQLVHARAEIRELVLKVQADTMTLDVRPGVPDPIAAVFEALAEAPVWSDSEHHYTRVTHAIHVAKDGTYYRRSLREGFRVAPGKTEHLEMDVAGGVPVTPDIWSTWTACRGQDGTQLPIEVIDAPGDYRKILRAALPAPIPQTGRFSVEFAWSWPSTTAQAIGFVGVKFRGLAHGVDRVEISLEFERSPWDVRFFKSAGRTVTEEQPAVEMRTPRDGVVAASYSMTISAPREEQWIMAWFAGTGSGRPE